jgi:hypothetical protein
MTGCVMPLNQPVTIHTFADEFLVVCPRCSRRARVQATTASRPARLTCIECGTSKFFASREKGVLVSNDSSRWPKGQYALGDAADPYFHLPLWLQIPCAAGVIWAFNERHLDYLYEYVSAEDRHRPFRASSEPRNALLESRLPRWMKLAKNRAEIVSAIGKLREQHGSRRA